MRLQIAGGLALYRKFTPAFKQILYPSANTLLLTGDCLLPDAPINNSFMEYLEDNWKTVIYIHGKSELVCPGAVIRDRPCATIKHKHRCNYQLYNNYTILGVSYVKHGDTRWLTEQEQWLEEIFKKLDTPTILASYSEIPENIAIGEFSAIIQGDSEYNQFNPKKGPIINRYTNSDETIRSSYNPEFSIEFIKESPKNVLEFWPSPSFA